MKRGDSLRRYMVQGPNRARSVQDIQCHPVLQTGRCCCFMSQREKREVWTEGPQKGNRITEGSPSKPRDQYSLDSLPGER